MTMMVVGEFHVRAGCAERFEQAFRERPLREPRPPVEAVYFGRSQDDPSRYRRVGVWASRDEWERFQGADAQRDFWLRVGEYLAQKPRFEFYELVEWPARAGKETAA